LHALRLLWARNPRFRYGVVGVAGVLGVVYVANLEEVPVGFWFLCFFFFEFLNF
jgi:hypothetical protein